MLSLDGVIRWSGGAETLALVHRLRRALLTDVRFYDQERRLIQSHADAGREVLEAVMKRALVIGDDQALALIILQEALSNAWIHGDDSQVRYHFQAEKKSVVQEYVYRSAVFDPESIPEPDPLSLDMTEGGRGIILIRSLSEASWTFADGAVTVRCVTTF